MFFFLQLRRSRAMLLVYEKNRLRCLDSLDGCCYSWFACCRNDSGGALRGGGAKSNE